LVLQSVGLLLNIKGSEEIIAPHQTISPAGRKVPGIPPDDTTPTIKPEALAEACGYHSEPLRL
jgi:hypothetical protein